MIRNPWFMLVVGLMAGLVIGYVLAEQEQVPPAPSPAGGEASLPAGHPPVEGASTAPPDADRARRALEAQAREIEGLLEDNPDDHRLMVALGNLYFDAGRWAEARDWYERALERSPDDAQVITDLAVVSRNLKQFERALQLLDEAIDLDPDLWQAWYNRVVVLHFDLHRHEEAVRAFEELERIAETNDTVPPLDALREDVLGS